VARTSPTPGDHDNNQHRRAEQRQLRIARRGPTDAERSMITSNVLVAGSAWPAVGSCGQHRITTDTTFEPGCFLHRNDQRLMPVILARPEFQFSNGISADATSLTRTGDRFSTRPRRRPKPAALRSRRSRPARTDCSPRRSYRPACWNGGPAPCQIVRRQPAHGQRLRIEPHAPPHIFSGPENVDLRHTVHGRDARE